MRRHCLVQLRVPRSYLMVGYFARDLPGIFVFSLFFVFPVFKDQWVGGSVRPLVRHFPHQKLSLAGNSLISYRSASNGQSAF